MKKIKLIIGLLLISFIWISCEKDVNINADYKDITIVYGLINPLDSVSYLRIEKAYLSDGDIYQAAQVADSNLYPYKLDVKIYSDNEEITFDTVTIYNKDEGIFYAPKMQVYYAVTKDLLNTNDRYRLKIVNPHSGEEVTSETKLINAGQINFDYPNKYISFVSDKKVIFNSKEGAMYYQLNIRFHYTEGLLSGNDTTFSEHFVDWIFPAVYASDEDGGEELKVSYSGDQFYSNLENNIPYKENVVRFAGQIEVIISMADRTFQTYLELNKPNNSIVQDRPIFTNIVNGYGLFASRSMGGKTCVMNNNSNLKLREYTSMNFVR